jgi:hypothetical protein
MLMRLATLLCLLSFTSIAQAQTRQIAALWDLDETHDGATFEVEVDGGAPLACQPITFVDSARRCEFTSPTGAHTYRLRGRKDEHGFIGGWSTTVSATIPVGPVPGVFTISFVGPIQIVPETSQTRRPIGNGDTSDESTVVGAATKWQAVNQTVSDENASYVLGRHTLFMIEPPAIQAGQPIQSVRVYFRAGYGWNTQALLKVGTAVFTSDEESTWSFAETYGDGFGDWAVNPVTNLPWTPAEVNALTQIGFDSLSGVNRTTQCWLVVRIGG